MDHKHYVSCGEVSLRPLGEEDIESLRVWRNDERNSRYIRKIPPITPEDQKKWYLEYLQDPTTLTFAVTVDSALVGSVALYDIKETSAVFGKLMIGDLKGRGIGGKATIAILKVAFEQLELEEVSAEVSVGNMPGIVIYTRVGFCIVGRQFNPVAKMDEFRLHITRDRFRKLMG